jgi:hypothetical protein
MPVVSSFLQLLRRGLPLHNIRYGIHHIRYGIPNYHSIELSDPETGNKVRFDSGQPGEPGWEGKDHYHVHNPDATSKKVGAYLDINGNPVNRGAASSHIAPWNP